MNKPLRIASLCPSNTEILAALGLLPYLVGVDNYSDYPSSGLQNVPRLGPDLQINMDKLKSLNPDLTIASLSVPGMDRIVNQLQETGISHIVLSPHRFNDIFAEMRSVAAACQPFVNRRHLEEIIASYEKRVARIATVTAQCLPQPRLYWEWWGNPIFSPAKGNWLTELSELAGAQNIFATVEGDQIRDDGTQVVVANPDYFLAVWTGIAQQKVPLEKIKNRPGWSSLQSFREGRFFILSEGLYCRPSPRLVDGLEQLALLIHPEIKPIFELGEPESYSPVRTWTGRWLGDVAL